jgi:membrane protein
LEPAADEADHSLEVAPARVAAPEEPVDRAPPRPRPTIRERRIAFHRRARDFLRRVVMKADQDAIFFMAGAIAFNVLVAIVPLILAALGIAGLVLANRQADPATALLSYLDQALPGSLSREFVISLRAILDGVIAQSTGLLSVSTIFFVWVATRLVGTLRTALREIFDIQEDRGIILGKLFDIQMVVVAGALLTVNVALTLVLRVLTAYGIDFFGVDPVRLQTWTRLQIAVAAFLSIWFMFVLMYRYLPARRIPWRIAVIAATFTSALFEVMKAAFSWYVTNLADYGSAYGNFATAIILFLWIYYMAVIFILGGEVGQVAALARIRRLQKERLN